MPELQDPLDDVLARAAQYRKLLDVGEASLEGLRVAAGLRDPAAVAALADLNTTARANRVGPWLMQLKGLPVDHLDLDLPDRDIGWLDALAGLPLRSLVLGFNCSSALWSRLPDLRLEALEIGSLWHADASSGLPSLERLRRLKLDGSDFDLLGLLAGGVLEDLRLGCCDELTDEGLRELSRLKLHTLMIERAGGITARGLAHLQRQPLKHLSLGWNRSIDDPSCLTGLTSLQSLRLDHCYAGDAVLEAIRDLPIEQLSLDSSFVTVDGLAQLDNMPLASLELNHPHYLGDLGDTLNALRGLPLKHLALRNMPQFAERGLAGLEGFALESLDLSLNKVTAKSLRHLAGLPLKALDLGFCRGVDGKALRALVDLGLPLERLTLAGLKLRDADLECLRGLPLRQLSLYESPWLTHAGVAHLAGLPLQHLTMGAGPGEAKISSAAVPVLAQLPLETLWLPNCIGIDAEGWTRLAELPARVTGPGI
jgi:Leucine Rich repeat